MGRSLGYALYLFLSKRATGYAERKLAKRLATGKEDASRISERRGETDRARPDGTLVWFHAASVGEALSIQELVRRIGEEREDLSFLITTGTITSAAILANRLPARTVHQYVPLDALPWVQRFLDHWQPDLAVWTESEFWPALMHETHKREIPMLLINARMSRKSFRRWSWMSLFAASLLNRFRHIHAQDAATGEFLRKLGVADANLNIVGTLKEGSAALPHNEAERATLAGLLAGRPLWLAASTHPGEDVAIVEAHRIARRGAHRLLLIIAPRHPERGTALAEELAADGWNVALRSRDEEPEAETEIYVADTLGEMGLWYRLSPISFVGGSLTEIGGHNPFEPAALGSAIIHGPHVQNFRDIYDRLRAAGAAEEVRNGAELGQKVVQLMAPDRAASMAHAAWEVCSSGAEVTDLTVALLLEHLPNTRAV